MSQELQQSVIGAGEDVTTALIASGGTVTAGALTVYEIVPLLAGTVASLFGSILTAVLICNHFKKGRLERKNLRLHNDILEQKKAVRKGEKP